MDMLEDGTLIQEPEQDPIAQWKTRNGVTAGGGTISFGRPSGMNVVNGQQKPFTVYDLNTAGVVLAYQELPDSPLAAQRFFFYDHLNNQAETEFLRHPSFSSEPWPETFNHRLVTVTDPQGNPTTKVARQVVGWNYARDKSAIWEEDPRSGQYKFRYLNQAINPNSGWDLQYAYGINDSGVIACAGSYQATDSNGNPVGTPQQKACLLVPAEFVAREGQINKGFDPTNVGPWASVGVSSTSDVVSFRTAAGLASRLTFVVITGEERVTCSSQLASPGTFHITLTGQSQGTAIVEAKLDGGVSVARLHVMVLPERTLSVAIYRLSDSLSPATIFPNVNTTQIDNSIVNTLNDVFKQTHVQFFLQESAYRNLRYDSNGDGVCQLEEWQHSRPNDGFAGQIRVFLIRKGPPGVGGAAVGIPTPGSPGPGPGGVVFVDDANGRLEIHAAHELGHALDLPVIQNSPDSSHDAGPWPPATSGLMKQGETTTPPGKWLRFQDWTRFNTEAGTL